MLHGDETMEQLSDWLGPAVALLWVLFRVVPRLIKGRGAGSAVSEPKPPEIPRGPERDAEESFEPRPIVPR
jgi:hypothetical protein